MRNQRVFLALLGLCLTAFVIVSVSSLAMGQTLQVPPGTAGSTGGPPITPEEQARDDQAFVLYKAGERAFDNGSYALAESDARQALALQPLVYRNLLAQALYSQGKFDEALPMYEQMARGGKLIDKVPYAMMLLKSGQWEKAIDVYNTAMADTGSKATGTRLGHLQFVYERYTHFDVDAYQPKMLETALHLAMGVMYNGSIDYSREKYQHARALEEYQQALALAPNSDITNYYLGYGLQKLGQTAKAQAAFQKAVSLGRGNVRKAAEEGLAQVNEKLESEKAASAKATNETMPKTGN